MKLRAARPGDRHVVKCVGGVITSPVPGYGLIIEHEDEDIFVPADVLLEYAKRVETLVTVNGILKKGKP